jgi:hypothetical protein
MWPWFARNDFDLPPMPIDDRPYRDQAVAFATMHGKDKAVAKAFARQLAASITVPVGIDTDAFGTFTGETPRTGTMIEAARAKARLGMEMTGLRCGLGSEGSFGPHPYIPIIPRDTEVLLFLDQAREIEICETFVTHRTNYQNVTCRPGEDISDFLKSVRFPRHAVVVTPGAPIRKMPPIKGIESAASLTEAIWNASHASADRSVQIVTDMRAHLNPTRMAVIRALAYRLARRLTTRCPGCGTPGFGAVDIARGLPCSWCGKPTPVATAEVWRCAKCSVETRVRIKGVPERADPGRCESCNP